MRRTRAPFLSRARNAANNHNHNHVGHTGSHGHEANGNGMPDHAAGIPGMYPGPANQTSSEGVLRWSRRKKDAHQQQQQQHHSHNIRSHVANGHGHGHSMGVLSLHGNTHNNNNMSPDRSRLTTSSTTSSMATSRTPHVAPPLRYSHADLRVAGWLSKRGKRLGTRVERFVTLRGCILANARAEGARPSWAINVRGANVRGGEVREIVIELAKTCVSFFAPSTDAHLRWLKALQAVSASVFDFYDKGKLIGKGAYSEVFLGRDKIRNELCAIKVLQRPDAEHAKLIDREVMVLHMLNHGNIVQIYDIFDTATRTYVVMEFLAGGELLDMITENDHLSERSARHVIREVLQAVYYLHLKGIVHRDVKPENILCIGRTWPLHVKLTDFGLSRIVAHNGDGNDRVMRSQCGTAYYLAPEIAHNLDYGKPVDLWACGVVLYVMLAGKFPFFGDNNEKFMRRLRAGVKFPEKEWSGVSLDAKALVRGLLDPCPASRLTAEQALNHRWLVSDEIKKQSKVSNSTFGHTNGNGPRNIQMVYGGGKDEGQSVPILSLKNHRNLYKKKTHNNNNTAKKHSNGNTTSHNSNKNSLQYGGGEVSEVSEDGDIMRTDNMVSREATESTNDLPGFITPVSTLGDVQSESQVFG